MVRNIHRYEQEKTLVMVERLGLGLGFYYNQIQNYRLYNII